MNQTATTIVWENDRCYLEVFLDPINKRIRVEDYRGEIPYVLDKAEELTSLHNVEKLIIKGRAENTFALLEHGLQLEAVVDRFFLGSDAYFFCKYYTPERKQNKYWITEDGILQQIYQIKTSSQKIPLPTEYELRKVAEHEAAELSALYQQVFQIYPTPLHDPDYVTKTMKDGTLYHAFFHQGKLVSAASAEINMFYKNAELTDCATLPEHRKYGLMKLILQELEKELKQKGIFCAYSIARSLSFGMNAALFQLGYAYRGRLMNNCYIYDKLEDMNMWVKNLAAC